MGMGMGTGMGMTRPAEGESDSRPVHRRGSVHSTFPTRKLIASAFDSS
jgi:hypothetical protein